MNDMSPRYEPLHPNAVIDLNLEAREWDVVLAGLAELPLKTSRPVFDRLMEQLQRRMLVSHKESTDVSD